MTFEHKRSVRLVLRNPALLGLSLAGVFGCEKAVSVAGPALVVTRIAVSPRQVALKANQTSQFMAVGLTAAGDTGNVPVTWTATAGSIVDTFSYGSRHYATYQPSAVPGNYLVIATQPPLKATADTSTVVVLQVPVVSVAISPAIASVLAGATLQLAAIPKDSSSNTLTGHVVTWVSSNTSVATVGGNGLVTGQAAGSATITATSEGKTGSTALTVQAPPPATHTGYYVTPTGTASGNGSASQPWDLATALASAAVHPGDTVWLRGGTYRGQFSSRLTGTPTNPIVVRQYPGERATIDGVLYIGTSGTSSVAAYSWYWGFEVMNSNQAGPYLDGVYQFAPGTKLINLVVHDAVATGIYSDVLASNDATEVYGCLSYNNGHMNNNNHGLYVMNKGPSIRKVTDNILFNNWAYGIQMYATYPQVLENLQAVGNVAFNNETIAPTHNNGDILIGGNLQQHGVKGAVISQNYTYRNVGYMTANIGWVSGQQDQDIVLTNNYFVGFVQITDWVTATITGNTIYGTRAFHPGTDGMVSVRGPFGGWTFSNNTLYGDSTPASWGYNDAYPGMSFAPWKATTGLRPGVYVGSAPTGVNVVVRPNQYELGRANIIVYNWAQQSTVSVDLSGTLSVGDHYVVQNVQDFYGTPVASGTYGGGSVQLPMAGITPPAPIGRSYTPAPITGPTFNAFVLMKTP